MRKFLPLLILVSLIVMISSCDQSKVTVHVDSGYSCEVDTSLINHYGEDRVKCALKRDRQYIQENLPVDASNFGAKKAEVRWRAMIKDFKGRHFVREVGVVTVVYYEKGLEIIKDGQHWFYDGYEYSEDEDWLRHTAGLSILHSPRWEPVKVRALSGISFDFDYPKNNNSQEGYLFSESECYEYKINRVTDLLDKSHKNAVIEY